jgi:hypothetical protein
MKTIILDGELLEIQEVAGKCKICGCHLVLQLGTNYPQEKDPMKLIPMATCNRCYDLREQRIRIETNLKRLCHELAVEKMTDDKRARTLDLIQKTCSIFSKWCASLLRRQHAANVGFLFSAIKEQPKRWYNHLKDFEEAANNG